MEKSLPEIVLLENNKNRILKKELLNGKAWVVGRVGQRERGVEERGRKGVDYYVGGRKVLVRRRKKK